MLKHKSRPILLLISGLIWAASAKAQKSANATGGSAAGVNGSVAYSIGLVFYTTNTGSNGSAAQGVQHAFEISTVGIKETSLNVSLTAFPNPTTDNLTLQTSEYNNEKLFYQLFDIQGKQLYNGQITTKQTPINMSGIKTGTYFLHVLDQENKKIQSFQIIKK
jgi:hypothetical protein